MTSGSARSIETLLAGGLSLTFFAHLSLLRDDAAFRPWKDHQSEVQHPDGIAGVADVGSSLPLLPRPHTKSEVLGYWSTCDEMVDPALDTLDLSRPDSGFSWYRMSKVEHQILNVRHIQHHTAQLADRMRFATDRGHPMGWGTGMIRELIACRRRGEVNETAQMAAGLLPALASSRPTGRLTDAHPR